MGIRRKEGRLTFARIERKTPALQSKQSSLCGLHRSRDRGGGRPHEIVSIKRAADRRSKEIMGQKKENYRAKNEYFSAEGQ